jgi:hypothetical protein
MKMTNDRPYSDPEKAAQRLMQHAHAFEIVQDGRTYIEKINGPFLYVDRGTPAEYSAGLKFAIERGGLKMHDRGTFVRFTQFGADLLFPQGEKESHFAATHFTLILRRPRSGLLE